MKDPRIERTKRHLFDDIVFIAIASVLSGGDSWNDMEEYGTIKKEWLSSSPTASLHMTLSIAFFQH